MRTLHLSASGSGTASAVANVTIPSAGKIKGCIAAVGMDIIADNGLVRLELSKVANRQLLVNGAQEYCQENCSCPPRTGPAMPDLTPSPWKRGSGERGFIKTTTTSVGFMDADASTSVTQMVSLFDALDGADCVIGSRWLPGSIVPERQGFARRLESRGFNILIRILFGLSLTDTQCGAKVFKKSAIDAVIGEMVSSGFEFDVELLWRLSLKGYVIKECPITWQNQGGSRVRGTDIFRMLRSLVSLRFSGGHRNG